MKTLSEFYKYLEKEIPSRLITVSEITRWRGAWDFFVLYNNIYRIVVEISEKEIYVRANKWVYKNK
jgi:hypothetical protein